MTDLIEGKACTCPSGDCSLHWLYPVHPPKDGQNLRIELLVADEGSPAV